MDGTTRPLTEPERRYLEWWLGSGSLKTGPGVMDKILLSIYTAGCLSFIIYLALALALKILLSIGATASAAHAFRDSPWKGLAIFLLPLVLWIWMLFYFFFGRRRKPPTDARDPKKEIQQDLSLGMARIHRFRATAVILAHGHRRRIRNYFVQLDDGRVLFLGAWMPPGCKVEGMTFLPDEKGFPSTEFEIAATPNNLLILDVVGTGEYLRPADEFELNEDAAPEIDPERLESGSFVDVPWENLRKTFG
jgi:hypothetical protein